MVILLVTILGAALAIIVSIGWHGFMNVIWSIFYFISKWVLTFIDFCQSLVRRLCGFDIDSGQDVLTNFINNDHIKTALLAIFALSVFLVFGFTMIQIIRSEWTTEGSKNAKGPIIKSALKSIFLFVLIPFASFLGIYVSNMLIVAVDGATNRGGNNSVAGQIFIAAAEDANILKNGKAEWVFPGWLRLPKVVVSRIPLLGNAVGQYDDETGIYQGVGGDTNKGERKLWVENNTVMGLDTIGLSGKTPADIDTIFACLSTSSEVTKLPTNMPKDQAITLQDPNDILNYTSFDAVYYCYNLSQINYVVLITCGWFCLKAMVSIIFGLVMRIYKIAILFVISPYPVAASVLDGGSALNKWKGKFLGELFSSYAVVAGLNLFLMLVPEIMKIDLFTGISWGWIAGFFNTIARIIFLIVGCMMIKDIVGIVADLIGANNAMAEGEGMANKVGEGAKKVAGTAIAIGAAVATGGAALASSAASMINQNKAEGFAAEANANKELAEYYTDANAADDAIISTSQNEIFENKKNLQELESLEEKKAAAAANGGTLSAADQARYDELTADGKSVDTYKQNIEDAEKNISQIKNKDSYKHNEQKAEEANKAAHEANESAEMYAHKFTKWEARSKMFKSGSQNIMNKMISESGPVKLFNEATGGAYTKKGKEDRLKQVASMDDEMGKIVGDYQEQKKDAKKQNVKDLVTGKELEASNKKRYSKAMASMTTLLTEKEVRDNSYSNAIDSVKAHNFTVDNLQQLKESDINGGLSNSAIENISVNRARYDEVIQNSDASDADKKAWTDWLDSVEKRGQVKEGTAERVKLDEKSAKLAAEIKGDIKIDQSSIERLVEAQKKGTSLNVLRDDKKLSNSVRNLIGKAVGEGMQRVLQSKSDSKQDNILADLMRQMIEVMKGK